MKTIGPSPREVKKKLQGKWDKGAFLKMDVLSFPYRYSLGRISSRQMTERFDELREWIALYMNDSGLEFILQWETVNHRQMGKNKVPEALLFQSMDELSQYLGRSDEWKSFNRSITLLAEKSEALAQWGRARPLDLLRIGDELERLILLWEWMSENPCPVIYLRQIDLPGIDSKFTEKHRKILSQWLDLTLPEEQIDNRFHGVSRFEERYGYRKKPELIRFRFLDESLKWRGCDDISLPAEQFCRLYSSEDIPVEVVYIVENDICGLSFPPVQKGLVIFGKGYHFDNWKKCRWLHKVPLWYWGDLDTHGFAILDQFRAIMPHCRSFLMDRPILTDHAFSWGSEPKPFTGDLNNLTEEELSVYDDLRFNRIRKNLRLEQEFVRFGHIKAALLKCR